MPNRSDTPMKDDLTVQRALVDKKTQGVLDRWSDLAGRSGQMHAGILLRRLVSLYETHPDQLLNLGLMAKSESPKLASAA